MSWTGCRSTFVRQDTLRKLFLCHLHANASHAPLGSSPKNKTILSLILEPGTRKDDSVENRGNQPNARRGKRGNAPTNYKKRVVGCYRHKSVLQCFTGMVAMSILFRFHDAEALDFEQPVNKKERPGWQKKELLNNWRTNEAGHKATYNASKRVLSVTGIS